MNKERLLKERKNCYYYKVGKDQARNYYHLKGSKEQAKEYEKNK